MHFLYFDALGAPTHSGSQDTSGKFTTASKLFFPHPVHRQGLLLEVPSSRPVEIPRGAGVSFPMVRGEKVILRFIEAGKAAELMPALRRTDPGDG
jgi:hypothetical protein